MNTPRGHKSNPYIENKNRRSVMHFRKAAFVLLCTVLAAVLVVSCKDKDKPSKTGTGTDTGTDTTSPVTTADPPGGTHTAAVSVTLTPDESATVYYTNDGTTPTESDYTGKGAGPLTGIAISENTTLMFFSVDTAGNEESVHGLLVPDKHIG
jgi:hypothetical protein